MIFESTPRLAWLCQRDQPVVAHRWIHITLNRTPLMRVAVYSVNNECPIQPQSVVGVVSGNAPEADMRSVNTHTLKAYAHDTQKIQMPASFSPRRAPGGCDGLKALTAAKACRRRRLDRPPLKKNCTLDEWRYVGAIPNWTLTPCQSPTGFDPESHYTPLAAHFPRGHQKQNNPEERSGAKFFS